MLCVHCFEHLTGVAVLRGFDLLHHLRAEQERGEIGHVFCAQGD
jgi:hypothetical protein